MENYRIETTLHPHFFDFLFAYKRTVRNVFRDVLGLYEINHIAISAIDSDDTILTLSSTPALEYNLFKSSLWRFDNTYNSMWFKKYQAASWQSLYDIERYDELMYIKQIKHHYPIGLTLVTCSKNTYYLFSFASHRSCQKTQELFNTKNDDFNKIGLYCVNQFHSLFSDEIRSLTLTNEG